MWLLQRGHNVVRVGNHRLVGVISRVKVWRWAGWCLWVGLMGGRARAPRVIMDGHCDEVAMFTCS